MVVARQALKTVDRTGPLVGARPLYPDNRPNCDELKCGGGCRAGAIRAFIDNWQGKKVDDTDIPLPTLRYQSVT